MTVTETTDGSFAADVLNSPVPVLVEFTAEWCPPCKMIAPVLAQIAEEQADRLKVVALDADANPETVRRYQVMGMPTLALFVGGERVVQLMGARPRRVILEALEPHLPAAA